MVKCKNNVTENVKESLDDEAESDKENAAPTKLSRSSTTNSWKKSLIQQQDNFELSMNKSNINGDENEEYSIKHEHNNILADITHDYIEPVKPAVAKQLFSNTNEIKRVREISSRKAKQIEQKSNIINSKRKQKNAYDCVKNLYKNDKQTTLFKEKSNNENDNVTIKQLPPIKSNECVLIPSGKKILLEDEAEKLKPNNNDEQKILATDDDAEITSSISKSENIISSTVLVTVPLSLSPSHSPVTTNGKRKSVIKRIKKISESSGNISDTSNGQSIDNKRRKIATYGKISELISAEQKEAIEKYYNIDMSVIDEDIVKKNYTMNEKKQIICNLCKASYPRIDKCNVHIWGHLDMKPYRCNACDFATVTVTNIRCHIRKSHLKIKPFECYICSKRFATASLLEEHANTHTGAKPYQCGDCNFSSHSRQVLVYHSKTHKAVKDITCDICKRQFYSKGRLRAHMLIHNKNKALMCKYCSQHFTNADALQRHYDNVHSSDYVCSICGKRTKSRKALNNHQNVHSKAKFKCQLCPNVYKSSHILKEHLLKHEGIRKYICDICNKAFAQQSHLAAHKAVHSDKRFLCPGCQRPFNRHDNMKMHTKRCDLFHANKKFNNDIVNNSKLQINISTANDKYNNDNSQSSINNIDENNLNTTTNIISNMIKTENFHIDDVNVMTPSLSDDIQSSLIHHHTNNVITTVTESIIGLECF